MKKMYSLMALLCLLSTTAMGQVSIGDKGTLSGLLFGDYYWAAANHNQDIEGENGFWIRRIYLTYDRKLSDSFSSRLRLEMNSDGDFTSGGKMIPSVKDAYLKWKKDNQQVIAGISSTPTFGLVEDVWGYRSMEKTPLDLYGWGSSRDFGIAAKGTFGDGNKIHYHFMFGNGNSNKSETNRGKKVMLSLGYELTENVIVEAYGDWNDYPDNTDWFTVQGFAGYRSEDITAGALFTHQTRKNAILNEDLNLELASVFTHFKISEKATGILRLDHNFEPVPGLQETDYLPMSPNAETTLFIAGADLLLDEHVHLMPNLETVFYGETALGNTPDTDVMPRLTLFFEF